jgi:Flp pilus assembly protein TadG
MRVRRRQGDNRRGQAMVETTMVVGMILLVLVGVFAVSTLASDQNTATTAVRAGGRFAAELGNGSSMNIGSTDPLRVDKEIVSEVCKVASTMPSLTAINRVVVYRPMTNADGSLNGADLSDAYQVTLGTCAITSVLPRAYTLDKRITVHPSEAQVGVFVEYHYVSPTPLFHLDLQATTYTVVTLAPSFG